MIRIVFVDDDSNAVHAMRRTLHGMRKEWDMEFLTSGSAALASLAKTPADVIVSDMRMPGMDGWQLLAEVKKRHPHTVRLVLSGQTDPSAIMRLVGTAHQYIAKPGETETLKTAIAQTQLLKRLLSSDKLVLLVGRIGALPSFPKTFQDLLNCLRNPDAPAADAVRIIVRDVAMTANIMKLVNSAFFGARRTITSVDRAVAYLGFDTLSTLVLGHSLFKSGGSTARDDSSLEPIWQHSLQTATAARAIALHEGFPTARAEEAFLTGMLHDVGRVVFATRVGAAGELPLPTPDTDEEIHQQHADVGAYLLGLWGFPSHIVAAVALHHTPAQRADPGFDLTVLTHIADRLVHCQGLQSRDPAAFGIEPGLLEGLGLLDHLPQWSAALNTAGREQGAA
jgi:HD-like signal output (HDOD) protein/CheY-like chemotaxis protein